MREDADVAIEEKEEHLAAALHALEAAPGDPALEGAVITGPEEAGGRRGSAHHRALAEPQAQAAGGMLDLG